MTTKDKVLEILSQNKNKSVSGEKLAEVCQVSRAAIWKAVKSLREQGCIIDGTTNGGYLLSVNGDVFSHELFSSTFKNRWPEFQNSHLETFQEIDSTNTYAKRILSECGNLRDSGGRLTEAGEKYHQSLIVAESQTAGRGRLGRKFISPAKTGIYLSFRFPFSQMRPRRYQGSSLRLLPYRFLTRLSGSDKSLRTHRSPAR